MPSEISRLDQSKMKLTGETPFVVVDGETKTNARKRVVPVVLGAEFINQHIADAIEWLNRTTESNHSHRIAKLLITATDNTALTGHCCRHTFKSNVQANRVSIVAGATIGGWSGSGAGLSDNMLKYGTEGLAQSDVIISLWKDSQQIHKHLLIDEYPSNGNVLHFGARQQATV